jgi:hypothetical protein
MCIVGVATKVNEGRRHTAFLLTYYKKVSLHQLGNLVYEKA